MKRLAVVLLAGCAAHDVPAAAVPTDETCIAPAGTAPLAGLVAVCRDVFVDTAATSGERERLARDVGEARKALVALIGRPASERPAAIFCKSDDCILRYAGAAHRSVTHMNGVGPALARPTIVQVRVDPGVRNVVVHEMLHVEVATRVGKNHVPAWFDEGIVVSLSGEPDCREVTPKGVDDLRRLDGYYEFGKYTNQRELLAPTYCQSAAEVKAFMSSHGGVQGVLRLLEQVHDGASYYAIAGSSPPLVEPTHVKRAGNARWGTVHVSGKSDSFVVSSGYMDIADPKRAFTIALWLRAEKSAGVLAHVSTVDEPGWCEPFLGFDRAGRLTSQVITKPEPERSSFAIATDAAVRPLHRWTHVAMTWSPGAANRLYVDGAKVAEAAAPTYAAARLGTALEITWGSNKKRQCWPGGLDDTSFEGDLADMNVWSSALDEAQIRELAHSPPP